MFAGRGWMNLCVAEVWIGHLAGVKLNDDAPNPE